jgi:hypothetical protein
LAGAVYEGDLTSSRPSRALCTESEPVHELETSTALVLLEFDGPNSVARFPTP